MRIIFFGSTDFSLPIIEKIKDSFELVGVVIVKAKPKGRGLKVILPKIAEWAKNFGIMVFDPETPNEESFIKALSTLKPDLFVLCAYGHILSGELLKVPRLGGINIHPSLLPKYRGAAPIQRAIIADEKKTGVTIFFMDEKVDHGEMIVQKELTIEPAETFGSLSNRLSLMSAEMITDGLKSIEQGTYVGIKQNEEIQTYAPKIKKEEMYINWHDETAKIFNLIRALSPSPGARTLFRHKELIISQALPGDKKIEPGILYVENKKLYVGTNNSSLILIEVKPENRNRISGLDFINGFRIKEGERLG